MRRNIFKILGIVIVLILVAVYFIYRKAGEDMPQGEEGPQATALANRMLKAVNKTAWDTTKVVIWSFREEHHYVWDRERSLFSLKWDEYEAYINIANRTGQIFEDGMSLSNSDRDELITEAIDYFNNDSFWLCAPIKVFDPETKRSLVATKDGKEALLVTYTAGGTTPGDSYLWVLNENGLPQSWKMWVSIIPIGGVEFSWQDWITLPSGALVAKNHEGSFIDVPLSNINSTNSLSELGLKQSELTRFEQVTF